MHMKLSSNARLKPFNAVATVVLLGNFFGEIPGKLRRCKVEVFVSKVLNGFLALF